MKKLDELLNESISKDGKGRLIEMFLKYSDIMNKENDDVNISSYNKVASSYFKQIAEGLSNNVSRNDKSLLTHLEYCLDNPYTSYSEIKELFDCLFNKKHIVRIILFFNK